MLSEPRWRPGLVDTELPVPRQRTCLGSSQRCLCEYVRGYLADLRAPGSRTASGARTGAPRGPATEWLVTATASLREASNTSSVPSPPSANGTSIARVPASRTPRAIADAANRALMVPLNALGAHTAVMFTTFGLPHSRRPQARAVSLGAALYSPS
jgi:hypothetical protein